MSEKLSIPSVLGTAVTSRLIGDVRVGPFHAEVHDLAEKVGRVLGGDRGAEIGRRIDDRTKDVRIGIRL